MNSEATVHLSNRDPLLAGLIEHFGPIPISLAVLFGIFSVAAAPTANAADSHAAKGLSRRVNLHGPGNTGAMSCDVVQVFDKNAEPRYFMDVGSVVCGDTKCEIVTVRLHFDPLGNYERYELPAGGNLTKRGHQPFSPADHKKLHEILSDPYSQLKPIAWNQITLPKNSAAPREDVDAITAPTVLSKRDVVVVGAAYTCYTLWHWSHGEVRDVIREMTASASNKQDLIRYLNRGENQYVAFATDQLRRRSAFDPETINAVVQVMRHGSAKLIDPLLNYLATASSETGADCFWRCRDDEYLVADPDKRVQFLEALRESTRKLPAGYLDRFKGWLTRADSYYEVHLLLTLMEREKASSPEVVSEAMSLLESDKPLIVSRCYRYLKAQKLSESQQKKLEQFEQQHPDR